MMYTNERDWKFFFVMVILVNVSFGTLFLVFRGDPDINNNCPNQEFLNWSLVAAFSCYLMAILSFLIITLVSCGQKFFLNFLEYSFYGCVIYSCICVLGLNSSIDDQCGRLQTLALVYLIFTSIMYVIVFFGLCLTLCIFSGITVLSNVGGAQNQNNANQNQNAANQNQQVQQQLQPIQQNQEYQPLNNPANVQQNYQAY